MSDSPQYITCHCQHCDGGIEFDASGFDKGETRAVECPHCQLETIILVPGHEKIPAVVTQTQKPKESGQLVPYIGFKCEICDQVIEAENVRLGESIICPHCKCTQSIPRKHLEVFAGAKKQIDECCETLESLQKTAEQGNADAQNNLGVCYERGQAVAKDEVEAVKWYRKAAEQNHALAQCNLGLCYDNGRGVPKEDVEAVNWYRKAADQNHAQAQSILGACYANGRGVAKDEVEAVKWLRKAAEQDEPHAQVGLSLCYIEGQGVAKDEAEAVKWLRKAAELNCVQAQTLLGLCHGNGQGVPQDLVQAHVWLSLGAVNGSECAREAPAVIEKFMTPEQKAETAKPASELIEKFKSHGLPAIES